MIYSCRYMRFQNFLRNFFFLPHMFIYQVSSKKVHVLKNLAVENSFDDVLWSFKLKK